MRERWDVLCRVVDHYGDVGIAWRIARQLAVDPQRDVRLVVDGLEALARIEPRVDAGPSLQRVDGIAIVAWSAFDAQTGAAAVVIELLGCGLPSGYREAMERAASVWIDYEHLSAEAWVDGCHGLPSPRPPLTKHFYYPGFGDRTGGLPIEPGLDALRRAFVADRAQVDALWRAFGLTSPADGEGRIALFAYRDAPVDALFDALAADRTRRWTVLVADGSHVTGSRSTPTIVPVAFVDQPTFDRLLWACDVNFVRGEDSFVRAQVAARPFVWHVYRQPEAAHVAKLAAFEARYAAGLAPDIDAAQHAFWRAWNGVAGDLRIAAPAWLAALPALRAHAERWSERLTTAMPLVEDLVDFVAARRSGTVC